MTDEIFQLSDKAFSLFEGTDQDKEELLALHKGYLHANSIGLNVPALRKVWSDNPDCVWFNSTGYNYKGIEDWAKLWEYFGDRVEITEPAGSDTFVVTQFGGKEVTGRFRADVDVKAGDTFPFAINMEKAVAFDPKTEERIG